MIELTLYDAILITWLAIGVTVFFALLFIPAPYGRHIRAGWGPQISSRKGWVAMEAPAVVVLAVFYFFGSNSSSLVPAVFFSLWQLHYVHRAFVFPFRKRGGQKPMPVLMVLFGFAFNVVNGSLQGYYLFSLADFYSFTWLIDPRFLVGITVFFSGFVINIHSDNVLFLLREHLQSGYGIPMNGLFKWVSAPNYLGEILEWIGWAIATWSLVGAAFAFWTAANLVPRAISNHRWYHRTFADYPKERRILIPFLF